MPSSTQRPSMPKPTPRTNDCGTHTSNATNSSQTERHQTPANDHTRTTHRPAPKATTASTLTIGVTNTANNHANTTPSPSPSPAALPSAATPTAPTRSNTRYKTYTTTHTNSINNNITSNTHPTINVTSGNLRNQRQPKPPRPVNQLTTSIHQAPHQGRQGPRPGTIINNTNQSIARDAIQRAITSGTHTVGTTTANYTTLTNHITRSITCNTLAIGITRVPRHLRHTRPVRANGTGQRNPGTETAHTRTQATHPAHTDPHQNHQQHPQHRQHQRHRKP